MQNPRFGSRYYTSTTRSEFVSSSSARMPGFADRPETKFMPVAQQRPVSAARLRDTTSGAAQVQAVATLAQVSARRERLIVESASRPSSAAIGVVRPVSAVSLARPASATNPLFAPSVSQGRYGPGCQLQNHFTSTQRESYRRPASAADQRATPAAATKSPRVTYTLTSTAPLHLPLRDRKAQCW